MDTREAEIPARAAEPLWKVEAAAIDEMCSREAMDDLWTGVLASLRGVEDGRLGELALKAQALAAEERDPELKRYLEDRIDEIVYARAQEKRPARVLSVCGNCCQCHRRHESEPANLPQREG